jgi:acyl-CoA dehydrogenase family protein 9
VEAATTETPSGAQEGVSSFAKSLFMGEIAEELVFPWPEPDPDEQEKIRGLNASLRELAETKIDTRKIEEKRWLGDDVVRELGERGLCGLYVPEEYGGQGLSQTGYARVFETFAQIDATLSIVMGVHQSIGFKGIHLYGTPEQKERWLPDLASGRTLAGFALTEPEAGSDAYNIQSRAVQQADGSWLLNGEKRYIGNGSKGDVFTAFARAEIDGKDRHIALILEKGMKGFEVGERYDTMGLRGNDLRRLYFNDVRVPAENVLGEPGEGFRIAMQILNNGRIGLGTGSVGAAKGLLDLTIEHVKERRQFGRPLADFELVEEKIGWMVSYLFGLESTPGSPTTRSSRRSARSREPSSSGTRRTARCSSRAAPATCATSPTRRCCATFASSRSSRARTTSCAPSSRCRGSSPSGRGSRTSAASS